MSAITLWIWICAYLNCAGWTLSALHQLNSGGYVVALALGLVGWLIWWRRSGAPLFPEFRWPKLRRRFRRGFPRAFLVLAFMAFLGGALYAPSNYDALAYRIPRVLHWLDAGQWYWIHTIFDRLNNRSCGIEWVSAPILALFHSTRLLFLINFVPFLFFPGLVFSVFTRLGVRPRVAWHWMWLAPTGYCFLLQAGSIGNDFFGVIFAMAAVDFALRARTSGAFSAIGTSILAAAMMTSAKTNDLPLLLPWAVALLPSLKIMIRRPLATGLVCILAVGASGLPTFYFNWKMSGDWSGAQLSNGGVAHAIVYRTAANVVSLSQDNLVPPVFPMADHWNRMVKSHLSPDLTRKLEALIEKPACWFPLPQMQMEESAGFGFGLTALLGISWAVVALRKRKLFAPLEFSWPAAVRWAAAISLLAALTQANKSAAGRLFAAYYLLPCTIILMAAGHENLVRRRWWQCAAGLVFLMAAGLLVISPARPLFPRNALLTRVAPLEATHPIMVRISDVYSVYRDRSTAFAPALAELPPDTKIIGYIAFDKPETSLWQPWGARRIVHVCPGDQADDLKAKGVRYILMDPDAFDEWFGRPLPQWLQQMNATVASKISLRLRAGEPARDWYLIGLQ